MGKWINKKVIDLCVLGRGRVISQSEINNELGIYPVYSSQSQNNGELGRINSYDFDGEYVTWTTDGAYAGTVFYRSGKFNCTNVCGTLIAKDQDKLNLKYLAYLLSTITKKHVSYVGNPKLMNGIMAEIDMLFPEDKSEQTAIAEILIAADKAIFNTEALIVKYKRIKTGLMQDMLTRGIDENGNIRSKATHKFVVKNGIEVPEEWKVKQIIKTTYLKARIGWQGLKASEFQIEGPYLITGTDFENGTINWETCYHVSEVRYNEAKYIQIRNLDLLITKDGTIGKTAIVRNCPKKAVLNSGVFVMRCSDGSYINEFMYYILNSDYFKDYLLQTQGGSTINHLYQREFEKFFFPCPKLIEQQKIVTILNQTTSMINSEQSKLAKLQSIKMGLMQDLLSGRVRVPEEMIK